tara:strand:- start:365 stop:958 length:594 start_codon:yes stop_codon:yes gene_type:complete
MEIGNWEKTHTKDMKKEEYLNLRIYTENKEGVASGNIHYNLVIYRGRAEKPIANFYFRNEEQRTQYIKEQKDSHKAREDDKQERQLEKKNFNHTLKVGDILYTSWGYDQTNIDYYQVTGIVGTKMVKIRQICHKAESSEMTYDNVVPVKDSFIDSNHRGEEMTKRVQVGNGIRMSSFEYATLWDGKPQYETNSLFGH